FCETGQDEVLAAAPEHGALSFREAAEIANSVVSRPCPQFSRLDAAWLRPTYFRGFPSTPAENRAGTGSVSGRLAPHTAWMIRFADVQTNRTLTVIVPYRGRLGFALSGKLSVDRGGVHHLLTAAPIQGEMLMLPQATHQPVPLRDPKAEPLS